MYKQSKCTSWLSICAIVINWSIVKSALLFTTNSEYGVILNSSACEPRVLKNAFCFADLYGHIGAHWLNASECIFIVQLRVQLLSAWACLQVSSHFGVYLDWVCVLSRLFCGCCSLAEVAVSTAAAQIDLSMVVFLISFSLVICRWVKISRTAISHILRQDVTPMVYVIIARIGNWKGISLKMIPQNHPLHVKNEL